MRYLRAMKPKIDFPFIYTKPTGDFIQFFTDIIHAYLKHLYVWISFCLSVCMLTLNTDHQAHKARARPLRHFPTLASIVTSCQEQISFGICVWFQSGAGKVSGLGAFGFGRLTFGLFKQCCHPPCRWGSWRSKKLRHSLMVTQLVFFDGGHFLSGCLY